jgi:hypothetical protein
VIAHEATSAARLVWRFSDVAFWHEPDQPGRYADVGYRCRPEVSDSGSKSAPGSSMPSRAAASWKSSAVPTT